MGFAPKAERVKEGEDCVAGVCSRAFGVAVCNEPDMPQRGACKRMLDVLSSGEAERDRIGSPSLLPFSVRIWSMIDLAAAP